MMDLPKFSLIRQLFPESVEADIGAWLDAELGRTGLLEPVKPGQRVILTAGSRGIEAKPALLAELVKRLKAKGAQPLIFPAMGSHGGATAAGQVEVLAHLGVTEASVGAPVYPDWSVREIGRTEYDSPVFADEAAIGADHIILVNRVKEHTDYIGPTESGLLKMAVIGLGRRDCAEVMHRQAIDIGYLKSIHSVARVLIDKLNILGGVAILEDHHNRLRRLEAVRAGDLFERELALLKESQEFKPRLPFARLDLLIVEEIGKDISGTGADTKVVGRIMNRFEEECTEPVIKRLVFLDLSAKTYGNATGIGMADFICQRIAPKIDVPAMMINCLTGGRPEYGRIPLALPDDRAVVQTAVQTSGLCTPAGLRAAWIANTKKLERLAVSAALAEEAAGRADLAVEGTPFDLPFNQAGELTRLDEIIAGQGG